MTQEEQQMLDGPMRARISNEIVRLHSQYYGRGPTRARVYADGDLVAVVLEETFTPAEKTLVAQGEAEAIQDLRRRFQRAMADKFSSAVEEVTGRRVRSFMSETDVANDVSIEIFLLDGSGSG